MRSEDSDSHSQTDAGSASGDSDESIDVSSVFEADAERHSPTLTDNHPRSRVQTHQANPCTDHGPITPSLHSQSQEAEKGGSCRVSMNGASEGFTPVRNRESQLDLAKGREWIPSRALFQSRDQIERAPKCPQRGTRYREIRREEGGVKGKDDPEIRENRPEARHLPPRRKNYSIE